MIDRESRDRLAVALRHYVAGLTTNDELDETCVDRRDRGAVSVKEMSWFLYCDTRRHRATGKFRLSDGDRREVVRWISFLYSDQEYIWPEYHFIRPLDMLLGTATLGLWTMWARRKAREFQASGDFSVWPFQSADHLENARRLPRLLAGHRAGY